MALPAVGLFLQPWVYDYGLLDEFSINAYWAGAYRKSLDAALKLLAREKLPPSMVKRIAGNARFAADKVLSENASNVDAEGGSKSDRDAIEARQVAKASSAG